MMTLLDNEQDPEIASQPSKSPRKPSTKVDFDDAPDFDDDLDMDMVDSMAEEPQKPQAVLSAPKFVDHDH
jgi:hypothetical protein